MPHSPRWHDGRLWMLESGIGALHKVDPETGAKTEVTRVPGFTRGMSFAGPFAFVGLSQVREALFEGIPLKADGVERSCGVWAIDLRTGTTAAFLRFEGIVQEIYEVAGARRTAVARDRGAGRRDPRHRLRAARRRPGRRAPGRTFTELTHAGSSAPGSLARGPVSGRTTTSIEEFASRVSGGVPVEGIPVEDSLDTPVSGNRAQRHAAKHTKKAAALGSGLVLAGCRREHRVDPGVERARKREHADRGRQPDRRRHRAHATARRSTRPTPTPARTSSRSR